MGVNVAPCVNEVVNGMMATVSLILPSLDLGNRWSDVIAFVVAAYEYADLDFNIDKAVVWGDNFTYPASVHQRDARELAAMSYDLTGLIRSRQLALLTGRLNHARISDRDPSMDPNTWLSS
jgi:hypothetical protein